jgi:hypothetical protein
MTRRAHLERKLALRQEWAAKRQSKAAAVFRESERCRAAGETMNRSDAAQLRERAQRVIAQLATLERRELSELLDALFGLSKGLLRRGDIASLGDVAAAMDVFLRARGVQLEPPSYVERLRAMLRRIRAARIARALIAARGKNHDPDDTSMFDV